jgi:hypothetical protein
LFLDVFSWIFEFAGYGRITRKDYLALSFDAKALNDIKKAVKLTSNQICRVRELLIWTFMDKSDADLMHLFRQDVKTRIFLANKTEFQPFKKKKQRLLLIDGD